MLSPFAPQNVPVEPGKHLPALQELPKDETRHRPRISLYRWLGQHHEDERRVTFKTDEKLEKEQTKEKDGLENMVQKLLQPKVSPNETKEYERLVLVMQNTNHRYIAHPQALTMTVPEQAVPEYTAYIDDAYKNNYTVDESDLKLYETSTSMAAKGMKMRATLVDKDDLSRRRAQTFQAWVKGQRKA